MVQNFIPASAYVSYVVSKSPDVSFHLLPPVVVPPNLNYCICCVIPRRIERNISCHVAWPDKHSISRYRLSIHSNNHQLRHRKMTICVGCDVWRRKNLQPGAGPCFGSDVDTCLSLLMITCFMQMIVYVKTSWCLTKLFNVLCYRPTKSCAMSVKYW